MSELPRLVLPPPARERVAIARALIAMFDHLEGINNGVEWQGWVNADTQETEVEWRTSNGHVITSVSGFGAWEGTVEVKRGTLVLLKFSHHNAPGAASTIAGLIESAYHETPPE